MARRCQDQRCSNGARVGASAPRDRPQPNTRVTEGKLEGRHFALRASDEAKKAESRVKERGTS